MKTLIKPLLIALSFSVIAATVSPANANPIGRPTGVATYKSSVYASVSGKLNIALDKQMGGSVIIRLKGADGSVLFNQYVGKNEQKYRSRLDMNELPDGQYELEITNGLETTRQTVTMSTPKTAAPERIVLTQATTTN